MKRLAAIFVVAAGLSVATPITATAGNGALCSSSTTWPLNLLNMPYCE